MGKTSIITLEQIVSIQIRCSLSTEQTQIKIKIKHKIIYRFQHKSNSKCDLLYERSYTYEISMSPVEIVKYQKRFRRIISWIHVRHYQTLIFGFRSSFKCMVTFRGDCGQQDCNSCLVNQYNQTKRWFEEEEEEEENNGNTLRWKKILGDQFCDATNYIFIFTC